MIFEKKLQQQCGGDKGIPVMGNSRNKHGNYAEVLLLSECHCVATV